jgi:predicted amidophosphoribosyltransferase
MSGRLDIWARGPAPAPELVVLVDDVHTTGATLGACAGVLRRCGARQIGAVTWARTLDHRSVEGNP